MQFEQSGNFMWPLQDAQGRRYGERADGYVSFGDVTQSLLDIAGQFGSWYINGQVEGYPALGRGLRFNGLDTSGFTHHEIGIHPDDIEEFVRRHAAYVAFERQRVYDNEGNAVELDEDALHALQTYLDSFGANEPWERPAAR